MKKNITLLIITLILTSCGNKTKKYEETLSKVNERINGISMKIPIILPNSLDNQRKEYAEIYPEGIEDKSFEKLLTHEMAHRLHIRILDGNEEAMGPIWFFEGFAIYIADQLIKPEINLSKKEMYEIP